VRVASSSALVLVLGAAGCFNPDPLQASGSDTDPGAGSSSSSSSGTAGTSVTTEDSSPEGSSESGVGACELCVPSPPQGWSGPMVLGEGETAPTCAAPYTAVLFEAAQNISGDDAACTCECGDPTIDCDALQFEYGNACAGPFDFENFADPETCHDTSPTGPSSTPFFFPISGTEACPGNPTIEVPEASLTELVLCGAPLQQNTCSAEELCAGTVPEGFSTGLCVAQAGEHECPEGYPEPRTAFSDVEDTRRCSACTCSPGGAFTCASELEVFDQAGCMGTADAEVTGMDQCFDSPTSFRYTEPTVTGVCTPSATEPTGTISGADPLTICCR